MNIELLKEVAKKQEEIMQLAYELQDLMSDPEFDTSLNELVEVVDDGEPTEEQEEVMGSIHGEYRDFLSDLR